MRLKLKGRSDMWTQWFSWHPVIVEGVIVWLEHIERRWNPQFRLQIIHPDDRGDYAGGWEYRLSERQR